MEGLSRLSVCSRKGWEGVLEQTGKGKRFDPLPADVRAAARELDFAPRIRMDDDQVEVNVTTFCQHRGIEFHRLSISRQFPHRILEYTRKTLISHSPGFVY